MANWWDKVNVARIKRQDDVGGESLNVHSIDELEPLYPPKIVAEFFDVTVGTIYKWVMTGLIKPTRQGRDLRFTAKQIAECKHKRQHQWRKSRRDAQLEKVSG